MKLTEYRIPFNRPSMVGREALYMTNSVRVGKISGDGPYTQKCHSLFTEMYGFNNCLLTTSCTHALELAALVLNIKPGDEVILPSYTFVSTANAFALRGASLKFADSQAEHPNICVKSVESLITKKTKVVVPVHYAGVACPMEGLAELALSVGAKIVEDAAQAIDCYYRGIPLGGIGDCGAFSFHETKNIIAGEAGLFVAKDDALAALAEIVREKGTNRSAFFRGEVDRYGWRSLGSSYLPSDLISAFLLAQLECKDKILSKRRSDWERYQQNLAGAVDFGVSLPAIPSDVRHNGHIFYLVFNSSEQRIWVENELRRVGILAATHYRSLEKSEYFRGRYYGKDLRNSHRYSQCLLRLPLYYDITKEEVDDVSHTVLNALKSCNC